MTPSRTTPTRCLLLGGALVLGCRSSPTAPSGDDAQAGAAASVATAAPSGSASPPLVLPENGPKIASLAQETWIYERPDASSRKIGYLRAGAVMRTTEKPAGFAGCAEGLYPIEPRGFVCKGPTATLDLSNETVRALSRRPSPSARMPYMYGIVKSTTPLYARLPERAKLAETEPDLDRHLKKWFADREAGASYGQEVWQDGRDAEAASPRDALEARTTEDDRIPWFLRGGRQVPNFSGLVTAKDLVTVGRAKRRNGLAMIDSFLFEGRRYNVTTDLLVVPADRLRPIRGSAFHGYEIPGEIDFPFAIIRKERAHKWRFEGKKNKLVDAGEAEWRSAVKLTGKQNFFSGKLHFETDDGSWVSDADASRLDPAKKMPGWATAGEKWIDVNITKQTLVAYEGTKAVFATLVSTGEAGLGDPQTTHSTTRGIFRIHTKHVAATMDSTVVGEEFELRDIPYVQYFQDGYALHAAYWHDGFGQPRSHGCINLAPEDARRLFYWTEPQVPPGWHGVMKALTGTVVFTHP